MKGFFEIVIIFLCSSFSMSIGQVLLPGRCPLQSQWAQWPNYI